MAMRLSAEVLIDVLDTFSFILATPGLIGEERLKGYSDRVQGATLLATRTLNALYNQVGYFLLDQFGPWFGIVSTAMFGAAAFLWVILQWFLLETGITRVSDSVMEWVAFGWLLSFYLIFFGCFYSTY
jgi:hypothetical protein